MQRSAPIVSLALHAALLFWISWRCPLAAGGGGTGLHGGDAPFFATLEAGATPADLVPVALLPEPVHEPQTPVESFAPPAVPENSLPPPITAFATIPADFPAAAAPAMPEEKPAASPAKGGKTPHQVSAAQGGASGSPRGMGAGSGGNGNGTAGYVPPQFLLRYKPPYPEAARAQRLEGTVLLLVVIDAGGRVTSANVLSSCGHPLLDRAALDSVRSWRFDPALQDGRPVAARVELPVRFCLGQAH